MPMHPRITELAEYVDAQRAALMAAADSVPVERWTTAPAPGAWSVAELLEHLYKVEHSCARVIAKTAAAAREAGHPAEVATSSKLDALDDRALLDRSAKIVAPERVAPTGTLSPAEARAAVERSRAELHAAIAKADGMALETVRATHARFGEIDLYQWILFVGQHEARHVQQMTEIAHQLGASPAARA